MTLLGRPRATDDLNPATRADHVEGTTMVNGPIVDEPELDRGNPDPPASGEPDAFERQRASTMPDEPAEADAGRRPAPAGARTIPWPIAAVVGLRALALIPERGEAAFGDPQPGDQHGSRHRHGHAGVPVRVDGHLGSGPDDPDDGPQIAIPDRSVRAAR
jgi:hypothetical protein